MFFLVCLSCQNEMDNDSNDSIVGKWKLMKEVHPYTDSRPITYDYSMYDIIYNFKENGIMEVSGVPENIDNYLGKYMEERTYSLLFIDDGIYALEIGTITYPFAIKSNKLEIGNATLDGYIYYFVKFKK